MIIMNDLNNTSSMLEKIKQILVNVHNKLLLGMNRKSKTNTCC